MLCSVIKTLLQWTLEGRKNEKRNIKIEKKGKYEKNPKTVIKTEKKIKCSKKASGLKNKQNKKLEEKFEKCGVEI